MIINSAVDFDCFTVLINQFMAFFQSCHEAVQNEIDANSSTVLVIYCVIIVFEVLITKSYALHIYVFSVFLFLNVCLSQTGIVQKWLNAGSVKYGLQIW